MAYCINASCEIQGLGLPLCRGYLFVFFEPLPMQVQHEGSAQDRIGHWALGVLPDGQCEVLGVWLATLHRTLPWAHVSHELQVRGVEKVRFIVTSEPVDGCAAYLAATVLPLPREILRQSYAQVPTWARGSAAKVLGRLKTAGGVPGARAAPSDLAVSSFGERSRRIFERWRTALEQLEPFRDLAPRHRSIVRSVAGDFLRLHRSASRAIDGHGCFVNSAEAAAVVLEALERAGRLRLRSASDEDGIEHWANRADRASGSRFRASAN